MLELLENFLENEKKSSTYKYAFLVALLDYIIEHPTEESSNNFHKIPILFLAKRFFLYYFPLCIAGVQQLSSSSSRHSNIEICSQFTKITNSNDSTMGNLRNRGFIGEPDAVKVIKNVFEEHEKLPILVVRTLMWVRKKILEQPLRYVKLGGGLKLNETTQEKGEIEFFVPKHVLFSLLNSNTPWEESYDNHRLAGMKSTIMALPKKKNYSPMTYYELEGKEDTFVILGSSVYRYLLPLRFWVRRAVINSWWEFSKSSCFGNDERQLSQLVRCFGLVEEDVSRESLALFKRYIEEKLDIDPLYCIYCEKELNHSYDLDHYIPWSKFPVNVFWNLYPACAQCNRQKSDKLVKMNTRLRNNLAHYLESWLILLRNGNEGEVRRFLHDESFNLINEKEVHELVLYYLEKIQKMFWSLHSGY